MLPKINNFQFLAKSIGVIVGALESDPKLAKLCDEGNIERYNGEIVTGLGESLVQAVLAKAK